MQGENLYSSLLDELVLSGVKGGQYSDGNQKDGFLKYEKGKPAGVIDKATGNYISLATFSQQADAWLGDIPAEVLPWKTLVKAADRNTLLKSAFKALRASHTRGCDLAVTYSENSRRTALKLISDGVAANENDVNTVMLTGFFHAYGPINDYL